MDSDSFFLSSSEFSGRVTETFKDVYKSEKFTDVTLITEDLRETRAHRLVLISGSKVLRHILSRSDMSQPVIYLRGVLHEDLQYVLQFIYHGDVTVPQECMTSVLNTAQDLKVHQLCGITEGEKEKSETETNNKKAAVNIPKLNKLNNISITTSESTKRKRSESSTPKKIKSGTNQDYLNDSVNESINNEDQFQSEEEFADNMEDADFNLADIKQSDGEEEPWEDYKPEYVKTSGKKKEVCSYCGAEYNNKASLDYHLKAKHLNIRHPCPDCHYTTPHIGDLNKHIKRVHEGKRLKCTKCDYEAGSKAALRLHMDTHEIHSYPCRLCDKILTTRSDWQKHLELEHQDEEV